MSICLHNQKGTDYFCKCNSIPLILTLESHKIEKYPGMNKKWCCWSWWVGHRPNSRKECNSHGPWPPNFDNLMATYPNATLLTHGENVGLPDGQMGNSEVGFHQYWSRQGHLSELARINKAVRDKELHSPFCMKPLRKPLKRNASVHLMGLVSDGGVHSHIAHLQALCELCIDMEIPNTFVHAFLDGRDTDPKSGTSYLKVPCSQQIEGTNVRLATVIGGYYAMDRDNDGNNQKRFAGLRHRRTKQWYHCRSRKKLRCRHTDGFVEAHVLVDEDAARIKDQDLVIFQLPAPTGQGSWPVYWRRNRWKNMNCTPQHRHDHLARYDDSLKALMFFLTKTR